MAHSGHGATVLVVEDDANALNTIRDYLSRAGFRIYAAANGWEAMKIIKDAHLDLIISELAVSDMDGASLREKLILNPGTRDIPFLFLVPEDKTDVLVRALRSGVDDCITKPFDPIVLVARIQAVIERRNAYERMVRMDPLTRLLNRPTFEGELREELSRVERYKRLGSVVYLDIDDFAQVNAESGVAMGDLLLTCLAGVILNTIRSMDIAGRFRGESFMVFLPETASDGAVIFASRMQEQMSRIADAVAGYDLSFSSGVVTVPQDGTDYDAVVQRLHQTLQYAKEHEKGSIALWSRDVSDNPAPPSSGVTEI